MDPALGRGEVSTDSSFFGYQHLVFLNITGGGKVIPNDFNIPADVLYYIYLINFWGLGLGTSSLGIITNIINIITFLRQSLKDAVNISLFGLAVTDFLALFTLTMVNLCFMPSFQALDLSFVALDVMYIWAWLHMMLTRVTSWITVYIILERCLCIAQPLKVKLLITPRRTLIYILALYIIMMISVIPIYYCTRAVTAFDSLHNKTLMGIAFITDRNKYESIAFVINCILPTSAFITTLVCTIILVRKLRDKQKWRQKSTGGTQIDTLSTKDTRVIRMVVFISSVFIICNSPGVVAFVWAMVDQDMRTDGTHVDLLFVIFSLVFHFESINASSGMFIYLLMSSRYKRTFVQTFCGCRKFVLKGKNVPAESSADN